jgi:hypothetical protein
MKKNWHSWVKKYFSTKFKNFNSGFFLVENFFLLLLWQFFYVIKMKRHSHFDTHKKNSTPDLQSLKWNGHALLFTRWDVVKNTSSSSSRIFEGNFNIFKNA